MRVVPARLPIDHDPSARNRKVHPNMIDVALPVMTMGRLQRHPAGAHTVGELLELFDPASDLGFG
jgi:hypothetical protein